MALVESLRRMVSRAKARRELERLDDRQLRDLGIRRDQIVEIVAGRYGR